MPEAAPIDPDVQRRTVQVWLDAIELAGKEEEAWRKRAEKVVEKYEAEKDETRSRFNILFSNTQTMTAAIYNSTPIPDIRPRFDREDQAATQLAQVLERAIETQSDLYNLNKVLEKVVLDVSLVGRGVLRARYVPTEHDGQVYQAVTCERVDWKDFRRGPGKVWSEVPWVAFPLNLTRSEVEKLVLAGSTPDDEDQKAYETKLALAKSVPMTAMTDEVKGKYSDKDCPEEFKRALVWEVWDKTSRKVIFLAKSVDQTLREEPDPLELEQFFPCPDPLYAVQKTSSLVPVEPYRLYQDQAEELDEVSRRIQKLAKAVRWVGLRAGSITGFDNLDNVDDGDFLPAGDDIANMLSAGGLDKLMWMMPTKEATDTLAALTEHRETIKQTIYEITGLSDILRGASEAQETATAQQIKSQWGSLRIRKVQGDVQGMARDVMRLQVEIIAEKFDPMNLQLLSGMAVTPEMQALLKQDVVRSYRIDIETDSTIRGDQTKAMEQMNLFLQGTAQYIQAMLPAVQGGMMPPDVAVKIYTAFASAFRLGKQAEDALDQLGRQAEQSAQAPQQPQTDPNEQAKLEQQKAKTEAIQVKSQADIQKTGMDAQRDQAKHAMDMEKLQFQAANPTPQVMPPGVAQ